jgi:hypothetical protein
MSDLSGATEESWGLRFRNGFQNLTVDLSQNVYVEQLPSHQEVTQFTHYVYTQSLFVALRLYNFTLRSTAFLSRLFTNFYRAIDETLFNREYMFFEGSTFPYPSDQYEHSKLVARVGCPKVEWLFIENENKFISRTAILSDSKFNHIPYLSAVIMYDDRVIYDISEFVNSVRWVGESMPSANHLVSAWSTTSGIVIERAEKMSLTVINTDGDEVNIPLRNDA